MEETAVRELLTQPLIFLRTPKWVEPASKQQQPVGRVEDLYVPLSELYRDLEESTERTMAK